MKQQIKKEMLIQWKFLKTKFENQLHDQAQAQSQSLISKTAKKDSSTAINVEAGRTYEGSGNPEARHFSSTFSLGM